MHERFNRALIALTLAGFAPAPSYVASIDGDGGAGGGTLGPSERALFEKQIAALEADKKKLVGERDALLDERGTLMGRHALEAELRTTKLPDSVVRDLVRLASLDESLTFNRDGEPLRNGKPTSIATVRGGLAKEHAEFIADAQARTTGTASKNGGPTLADDDTDVESLLARGFAKTSAKRPASPKLTNEGDDMNVESLLSRGLAQQRRAG